MERRSLSGALLGDLEEGGAGTRLLSLHAQVEVGIEIDDADPALTDQMTVETAPAAERHLVTASHHQREVSLIQQARYPLGQAGMSGIEIAVVAGQIPAVIDGTGQMPGTVGQQLADRQRCASGPHAPLVAAHPLVTGKAHQGDAGFGRPAQRPVLHLVVPAQGELAIFRILAPLPDRHMGQAELIHAASPRR